MDHMRLVPVVADSETGSWSGYRCWMDHMRLVLDSSPVTLLRVMALQVLDGSHAVGSGVSRGWTFMSILLQVLDGSHAVGS